MTAPMWSQVDLPSCLGNAASFLGCCAIHYLFGTVLFDLVHLLAHKSHMSSYSALRLLAKLHSIHHRFFDRKLQFNESYRAKNLFLHLPFELICQMLGSTLSWLFTRQFLSATLFGNKDIELVLVIQLIRSIIVAYSEGNDSNHVPYTRLPKDTQVLLVGPQYHSLHHMDPLNYFGSMIRLVDWVLGTAASLRGRRVAITGSESAFVQALAAELCLHGVKSIVHLTSSGDWTCGNYSKLVPLLADTDILIVANGTFNNVASQKNNQSAVQIIELFKQSRLRPALELIPEVWYVGKESECRESRSAGPSRRTDSKETLLSSSRAYYDDKVLNYRHIVPEEIGSKTHNAAGKARLMARTTLWWIRRGARYVPITSTGLSYLDAIQSFFWKKPYTGHISVDNVFDSTISPPTSSWEPVKAGIEPFVFE